MKRICPECKEPLLPKTEFNGRIYGNFWCDGIYEPFKTWEEGGWWIFKDTKIKRERLPNCGLRLNHKSHMVYRCPCGYAWGN